RLAFRDRKILAVAGDAGFLMNSMELETAVREKIPLVVLVWVDGSYGMIKWEMDLELGHHSHVDFGNLDFVKFAESFGGKGYLIKETRDLLPTLKRALADNGVSVRSELETAVREKIPLVVLVWVDGSYGMIKWEMDLELGHHSHVDFGNLDFVKFAESFGGKGYLIKETRDLLPTLKRALADNGVSV